MSTSTYDQLCRHVRQTAVFATIESLLYWDERCMMPPRAAAFRAEQAAQLAGLIHERQTDPRLGEWLNELAASPLAADPHSDSGTTIRQLKRLYEKKTRLPRSLVEELTQAAVLGQQAWQAARRDSDFAAFAPHLERIFRLKREQAEAVGYRESAYDALLDDFEPGELCSHIGAVLGRLRDALVPLVAAIVESRRSPPVEILHRHYPREAQERLGRHVAACVGFDFHRGRLDVTAHPFCSGIGPHDCRITTRYDESYFNSAFFGILHEAGHGIYDQGLREEMFGLPPGEAVSMGIHESQSRLWENLVGRSLAFWRYFYPQAQQAFPEALADVPLEAFYAAINDVRPSLIRVEADEATYNLHILVRFELEVDLLQDRLRVADLPGAWGEKYQSYLGIVPPDDRQGVLQDIHWSGGLVGYFPTYSLGNLYAAQFYAQADRELGGLARQSEQGEFTPLRRWLREKIHAVGQCYTAAELVERVTGRPLSHEPLVSHLQAKFAPLYGLG